jgi:hypothetical protein
MWTTGAFLRSLVDFAANHSTKVREARDCLKEALDKSKMALNADGLCETIDPYASALAALNSTVNVAMALGVLFGKREKKCQALVSDFVWRTARALSSDADEVYWRKIGL